MSDYTFKFADGTGRLQRGHYAYNETPDCMADDWRWLGPFRTEASARAAVRKAEEIAAHIGTGVDDELCRLACLAGRTPAMKRAREAHDRRASRARRKERTVKALVRHSDSGGAK